MPSPKGKKGRHQSEKMALPHSLLFRPSSLCHFDPSPVVLSATLIDLAILPPPFIDSPPFPILFILVSVDLNALGVNQKNP